MGSLCLDGSLGSLGLMGSGEGSQASKQIWTEQMFSNFDTLARCHQMALIILTYSLTDFHKQWPLIWHSFSFLTDSKFCPFYVLSVRTWTKTNLYVEWIWREWLQFPRKSVFSLLSSLNKDSWDFLWNFLLWIRSTFQTWFLPIMMDAFQFLHKINIAGKTGRINSSEEWSQS